MPNHMSISQIVETYKTREIQKNSTLTHSSNGPFKKFHNQYTNCRKTFFVSL